MTIKSDKKKVTIKTERQKNSIIEYLTDHEKGTVADFTELLGVSQTRVKQIQYLLLNDDTIEADGGLRSKVETLLQNCGLIGKVKINDSVLKNEVTKQRFFQQPNIENKIFFKTPEKRLLPLEMSDGEKKFSNHTVFYAILR